MAIELPVTLISEVRPKFHVAASKDRSPYSGDAQVQDWGGEWWEFDITFARHSMADGQAMMGFFAALRGVTGTFLLRPPYMVQAVLGDPVVNGAGQSGRVLQTAGWPNSAVVMKSGQHIQLGADDDCRLHILTADAVSDASGFAALPIWPALRAAPVNGSTVVVDHPAVRLRLEGDIDITISRPVRYNFTLSAHEAL